MHPLAVLTVLGSLLTITTISYFFLVPENIKVENTEQKSHENLGNIKKGFWGKPDAEFNWCEYDYTYTNYIAEFWNTITSMFYCVFAFLSYWRYKDIIFDFDLKIFGVIVALIGIGSTLFHATLKYNMQLLDEIPMYFLVCYASIILRHRNSKFIPMFFFLGRLEQVCCYHETPRNTHQNK